MSAVASLTAQNTREVVGVFHVPAEFVELQIAAVADDIGIDAVKTGMLATPAIIAAVARQLRRLGLRKVVVDPVMVATAGDRLVDSEAVASLRDELFPLALAVTPNLREAEILADMEIRSGADARRAAFRIMQFGPGSVVIKGGHADDAVQSVDLYYDGRRFVELSAPRLPAVNTHGGGCTFASAATAHLARGLDLETAFSRAKEFVTRALKASYSLGSGQGPLGHFGELWEKLEP